MSLHQSLCPPITYRGLTPTFSFRWSAQKRRIPPKIVNGGLRHDTFAHHIVYGALNFALAGQVWLKEFKGAVIT
jgi:hypothetical protein